MTLARTVRAPFAENLRTFAATVWPRRAENYKRWLGATHFMASTKARVVKRKKEMPRSAVIHRDNGSRWRAGSRYPFPRRLAIAPSGVFVDRPKVVRKDRSYAVRALRAG